MTKFRLQPDPAQEEALRQHCSHARFIWNLAVEQHSHWRGGRTSAPGYNTQCRQLTEARAEHDWLRAGSQMVQQQALRDFAQAMSFYFAGTHGRPGWRRKGRHEGFRIVAVEARHVRRLNRRNGAVLIPKVGWVRFRWTRSVPEAKSYRVHLDRAGRWHILFAVRPEPIQAPGTGAMVGVDRGIAVSAALSTGDLLRCPGLRPSEEARLLRLQRRLARSVRGSNRYIAVRTAIARLRARETDRRRDWVEKTSTDLARRFDTIRVENLHVGRMTRSAAGTLERPGRNVRAKAALNRSILAHGWGRLVNRLEQKAPGRVEKVDPAYTSQTCAACGHRAAGNRKSQAMFCCQRCGHRAHADVNAACNIAAGRAVTARRETNPVSMKREPQLAAFGSGSKSAPVTAPEDVKMR